MKRYTKKSYGSNLGFSRMKNASLFIGNRLRATQGRLTSELSWER